MSQPSVGPAGGCLLASVVLAALGSAQAGGPYASDGVSLQAHLNLAALGGGASSGSDCWGYVSPSGREYALMGVDNQLVVVEITTPNAPVIVGSVSHTSSSWCDIKVYLDHAYVVNESGGGLDVIDLSNVDGGVVTLVQRFTGGGLNKSHDVAIDTDSGFLYLCGSNLNGGRLVAYDLSNPGSPVFVGQVASGVGAYVHDAEIVTFTSGDNAGKQIAFCANGSTGLDIYDVTDKSNMFRLSRSTYPNLTYCHQGWLSADGQFFYLDDETDGINETVVFDVSDLANPVNVSTYNSGVTAADHNLYVKGDFIFEAEYHAGLRIFCTIDDPINPIQVGWFDSYPADDAGGFAGAWGVYPFFPSGTVIISDTIDGLFVVDPSAALAGTLDFSYPNGQPDLIAPQGGTTIRVELAGACGAVAAAGTGLLHYDIGAGFVSVPMTVVSPNVYDAVFPAFACADHVRYYFSAETVAGAQVTDPTAAPAEDFDAVAGVTRLALHEDHFEADLGWVPLNLGATSGLWERGVPVDDPGWAYDPATDGDGSGQCWLTQNQLGNTDVDDGGVQLTSPILDMSAENVELSYLFYLLLTNEDGSDRLLLQISSNGDFGPWIEIARHDTGSAGGLWELHTITQAEIEAAGVTLNASMKVRFLANDSNPQSIVEAGIDDFHINQISCDAPCPWDCQAAPQSGAVDVPDLLALLGAWGGPQTPGTTCDLDGSGAIEVPDLLKLLANWGPCP